MVRVYREEFLSEKKFTFRNKICCAVLEGIDDSSSASEPETKIKGIIDHLVRTISAAAWPSDTGRSKSERIRSMPPSSSARTKSTRVCTARNDAFGFMVTHFPMERIGPSLSTMWVDCRFSSGTTGATAGPASEFALVSQIRVFRVSSGGAFSALIHTETERLNWCARLRVAPPALGELVPERRRFSPVETTPNTCYMSVTHS